MSVLDDFRWGPVAPKQGLAAIAGPPPRRTRSCCAAVQRSGGAGESCILPARDRGGLARFSDDQTLLAAAARGNRSAQDEVARRLACVPRMIRLRHRRLGRALDEKLDDLVQDVVLAVWARLDRFTGHANFEAWVWGFVQRITYRQVETYQRRPPRAALDHARGIAVEDDDLLASADRAAHLQRALGELDPLTRRIVQRRSFLEQTFEDIGKALDMPANSVKTRYYRALGTLGAKLHPQLGEEHES